MDKYIYLSVRKSGGVLVAIAEKRQQMKLSLAHSRHNPDSQRFYIYMRSLCVESAKSKVIRELSHKLDTERLVMHYFGRLSFCADATVAGRADLFEFDRLVLYSLYIGKNEIWFLV